MYRALYESFVVAFRKLDGRAAPTMAWCAMATTAVCNFAAVLLLLANTGYVWWAVSLFDYLKSKQHALAFAIVIIAIHYGLALRWQRQGMGRIADTKVSRWPADIYWFGSFVFILLVGTHSHIVE